MKRREFFALLGSAIVATPSTVRAQQTGRIPRIGVLWHAGSAEEERIPLGALVQGFRNLGYVEGRNIILRGVADFAKAFSAIADRQFQAVSLTVDGLFYANQVQLGALAYERKLPLIGYAREMAKEAGMFLSYGPSNVASFNHTAYFVDRILKGEKPADLPVEQPTKFELVANLKAAKALGISVPTSILLRADEVIE